MIPKRHLCWRAELDLPPRRPTMALRLPWRTQCTFLYLPPCRLQPRFISTTLSLRGSGKPSRSSGQVVQQVLQRPGQGEVVQMKAGQGGNIPQDLGLLPRLSPPEQLRGAWPADPASDLHHAYRRQATLLLPKAQGTNPHRVAQIESAVAGSERVGLSLRPIQVCIR